MSQTPQTQQIASFRQPSMAKQNRQTSFGGLRKKSGSVTLAFLLAMQACTLGTNGVSARPNGILQYRGELGGQFPVVSSDTLPSSSSTSTPLQTSSSSSSVMATSTASPSEAVNKTDNDTPILLESTTQQVVSATSTTLTSSTSSMTLQPTSMATNTSSNEKKEFMERQDDSEDDSGSEDDEDDDQSCSSPSSSDGSDSDSDDANRKNTLNAFPTLPLSSASSQLVNNLPLVNKRREEEDDKINSWFSSFQEGDGPHPMQKDDGEMYGLMKRMIRSNEEQMKVQKRVLNLLLEQSFDERGLVEKRQEDPSTATSSSTPTPTSSSSSFPTMATIQHSSEPMSTIADQWTEHENQNGEETMKRRDNGKVNDDDMDANKRHQLLASAMSDWGYVSSWLSSHLPVELHKQVEQALQSSSTATTPSAAPAVQKAVADSHSSSTSTSNHQPSYVDHGP